MLSIVRPIWRAVVPHHIRERVAEWRYRQSFDRLFGPYGPLQTTVSLDEVAKRRARAYFQHREKAEATLSAATSWYGGDYMEFGSAGLYTFRDMLSAFDIAGLHEQFPDTKFYGFDCFGKLDSNDTPTREAVAAFDVRTGYFSAQFPRGDELAHHQRLLEGHGLFVDQCRLVQGLFQDTLTPEFAAAYRAEGRKIGYAFIDCNFEETYAIVFEFIFSLMAENSHIYMDEYHQSSGAAHYFAEFATALRERRQIECQYVRAAGAFGALFRLRPVRTLPPIRLS